jgi:hypothetical protein
MKQACDVACISLFELVKHNNSFAVVDCFQKKSDSPTKTQQDVLAVRGLLITCTLVYTTRSIVLVLFLRCHLLLPHL